jgi:LysR family hydrogen peroxide-inducible transcriptional activator
MTLTQLHYMTAVAEYGNFTLAADKCFVTQPTLSMQVQKLEEELGVKIFNRSNRYYLLTLEKKFWYKPKKLLKKPQECRTLSRQKKAL